MIISSRDTIIEDEIIGKTIIRDTNPFVNKEKKIHAKHAGVAEYNDSKHASGTFPLPRRIFQVKGAAAKLFMRTYKRGKDKRILIRSADHSSCLARVHDFLSVIKSLPSFFFFYFYFYLHMENIKICYMVDLTFRVFRPRIYSV